MNQHVNEQNERLRNPGSLMTENQKRTENRMDQKEEAIRQSQQMQHRTEVMFLQFSALLQEVG